MNNIMRLVQNIATNIYALITIITFSLCVESNAINETKPNEPGPLPGMLVNTYTGNFFYQRTDLHFTGPGLSFEVTLSYNSARSDRDLGYGNGGVHPNVA